MRVIQVGLGYWGRQWAQMVRANPAYELVAVVDADHRALDETRADHGLPDSRRFKSLSRALDSVEAEAVLIITSAEMHAPLALEALKAGKHVLCEKPMALTLAEAQAMLVAAEQAECYLMIAQNYRFRAPALTARSVIEAGRIGRVQSIHVRFARDRVTAFKLENDPWHTLLDHPVLEEMAIHHLDLVRFLLGVDAEKVYAYEWGMTPQRAWAPGITCVINMKDGTVVTYTSDWFPRRAETSWNGEWHICGERGSLVWSGGHSDWNEADMKLHLGDAATDIVPSVKAETIDRAAELVEFAAAVREGRQPVTSGQDNIRSLAIMFTAMRSVQSGQPEDVVEE